MQKVSAKFKLSTILWINKYTENMDNYYKLETILNPNVMKKKKKRESIKVFIDKLDELPTAQQDSYWGNIYFMFFKITDDTKLHSGYAIS